MAEKVGEEFPALVVSTTRFGMFVELEDLFVEGLVPLDAIPSDRFHFEENSRLIVGQRTGVVYRVGDHITVRLDRVDEIEKTMQFAIAGAMGKGSSTGGKKLTRPSGGKSARAPKSRKKGGRGKRR